MLGRQEAVRKVATTQYLFWVACGLVVTAGLARNYDHHLLLEEPMWILGPFGMAFFSSFLIFGFIRLVCRIPFKGRNGGEPFCNYNAWMRCFFMTAPLAWLYGIPYENFMPILPATQVNFATLLLVSLWRVYIMGQVTRSLFGIPPLVAYSAMLFPASVEMMFGSFNKTLNLVGIMGGMRISESDEFLAGATGFVTIVSFWLAIASLLLLLCCVAKGKGEAFAEEVKRPFSKGIIWLTGSALTVFLVAAVIYQPKLAIMKELRKAVHGKEMDRVVEILQETPESAFPKGHDIFASYYDSLQLKRPILEREAELPAWAVERLRQDVELLLDEEE